MPAARGAFDSVRHQQSPLCHAEGHHGRQEKRDCLAHRGFFGSQKRTHSEGRKNLCAGQNQKDRISHRCAQRSRYKTRRETQIRSAGDLTMKILGIVEQRQGKWNNTSFESLAAAQQIASAASGSVSAAVVGKGLEALCTEMASKNVAEVLQVEHDLLENYTPDGF